MSRLEIILMCILSLSLIFNVLLLAYARASIMRLLSVSEELGDLQQMINSFANHLQAVYELESFYGDTTLQNLLEHAVSFNEQLETFEYIYALTEEMETTQTDDNKEEDTKA